MVQEIATGLMSSDDLKYPMDLTDNTRGEELAELLTDVCRTLEDVGYLTEGKADIEFLLGIQASYLLSVDAGKIGVDDKPPSILYDDIVFPQIDAYEEVVVEEIEDEDREQLPTGTTEAEVS